MKTLRLLIDATNLDAAESNLALDQAAVILRAGGLVALPTETVYGLGANALDAGAVERIFLAKQRPFWDPVIVHIATEAALDSLVAAVPDQARKLMAAFWPGPLTLLLPRTAAVPDLVTAGRPLVGLRMPAHPVALELIRRAGVPVAAPSANTFGHISPTTAKHVLEDLDGRIDAVLDAGPTLHGVESTVLDPCQSPMVIYRPGAVTIQQIQQIAGAVKRFESPVSQQEPLTNQPRQALPSPGVGLRHYAPKARLKLVEVAGRDMAGALAEAAEQSRGRRVGVMLPTGVTAPPNASACFDWGNWSAPEELASRLYAGLRALDAEECSVILCAVPSVDGIGAAIRDRINKASQAADS